jgi:hypothetical protein
MMMVPKVVVTSPKVEVKIPKGAAKVDLPIFVAPKEKLKSSSPSV